MNSNVYFVLLLVLAVTIPTLSLEYSGDREDATTEVYGKFVCHIIVSGAEIDLKDVVKLKIAH